MWDNGSIVLSSNGSLTYTPNQESYALPSLLTRAGTAFTVAYGVSGPTGPTGADGPNRPHRADRRNRRNILRSRGRGTVARASRCGARAGRERSDSLACG